MGFARTDFDTVAPLQPLDEVAGRVTSKGEHFDFEMSSGQVHASVPLPVRRVERLDKCKPNFRDFTGVRVGRLTVLGISTIKVKDRMRWVVKCLCGSYEVRKARSLTRYIDGLNLNEPRCAWCEKTVQLQNGRGNRDWCKEME